VEALLNDSLNFRDYIERRAGEAVSSHERGRAWRQFVVKYLDFFDSELLGLFVDDTDVLPHHTVDLLHSIRMFCCHPRIVSVVAGNLHSMRQRLLMDSMDRLSGATRALRGQSSYTAAFWRSFERESIEEYLEKVFPRPNRHFLSIQGTTLDKF
jgi:hypothetical protein